MSEIQNIPLSSLVLSDLNVRKIRPKETIEEFARSIEQHGVIQNLRVHPVEGEKFGVVIGGTRLAAMQLLLKQKKITGDYLVPCEVRDANDPTLVETSLVENITRVEMHPIDQWNAIKKLNDQGDGPETIAAKLVAPLRHVNQFLKIATTVSPKLITIFEKGEMSFDQVTAFTIESDRKKQEKVWRDLPDWAKGNGRADQIRAALTNEQVEADSAIAKFVTLEAYEKAGGGITRDLFADKGEGWLTDSALVNRLAEEKLTAAAIAFRSIGWKWVEVIPNLPYEQKNAFGHLQPGRAEPDEETSAKIAALQAEADKIMKKHGEEPDDEAAAERLGDLYQQIDELSDGEPVYTLAQMAVGGVLVTIGHNGEASVLQGLVKPEDKGAARKLAHGANGAEQSGNGAAKPEKAKGGLSAALVAELTSQKNVAAQVEMAGNPKVGLLAVTHVLALKLLYQLGGEHSSLGINPHETNYPLAINEQVEKSAAGKKLAGIVKAWQKKLPKKPEDLWGWMAEQNAATVQGLLAVCAALTIDVVQSNGAEAKDSSAELTKALKLDMGKHWTANAESYFSRVPKAALLAELDGAIPPAKRKGIEAMKREPMAKAISAELKGRGWLPPIMQAG
jgi:ParB family chromosome partitioning protein